MTLRLRLLNLMLRLYARPFLARVRNPGLARRRLLLQTRLFLRRPAGLRVEEGEAADPRVVWLDPEPDLPILLYFHGGAYQYGAPETHWHMVGRMAQGAGVSAALVDYRLAPENVFPAAIDDALAVYTALVEAVPDQKIVLGGDSAGGGLALALLHVIGTKGLPKPAGVIAFSPWTDLAATGASVTENARIDPLLPAARISKVAAEYLDGADARDPRASPLYGRFEAPPPAYLHVGSTEILRDDAVRMAETLRAAGGEVTLEIGDHTPHVVAFFAGYVPEANRVLETATGFLRRWCHPED